MKEKPSVGFPFITAFPSDRIPQATKGVIVVLFTIVIPVIYTSEFRGNFEAAIYIKDVVSSIFCFAREIEKCLKRCKSPFDRRTQNT